MKVTITKRVTQKRRVEITTLDSAFRAAGMNRRRERGQSTMCVACEENVEEDTFVIGFRSGLPNMILHAGCVPADVEVKR